MNVIDIFFPKMDIPRGFIIYSLLSMAVSSNGESSFSRAHVGVLFRPFVSHEDKNVSDGYNVNGLLPMISLISSKFSKTMMVPIGQELEFSNKLIPSAIATFNHLPRNTGQSPLELIMSYGLAVSESGPTSDPTNFKLAKQLADEANQIYGGTVKHIYFKYDSEYSRESEQCLSYAQSALSNNREYDLGIIFPLSDCARPRMNIIHNIQRSWRSAKPGLMPHIISSLAKVQNLMFYSMDYIRDSSQAALLMTGRTELFENCLQNIKALDNNQTIQFFTGWLSKFDSREEYTRLLTQFWKQMNDWAVKANTSVILKEAFDNPSEQNGISMVTGYGHQGLWRLNQNRSYHHNSSQYLFLEKSSGLPVEIVKLPSVHSRAQQTTPPETITERPLRSTDPPLNVTTKLPLRDPYRQPSKDFPQPISSDPQSTTGNATTTESSATTSNPERVHFDQPLLWTTEKLKVSSGTFPSSPESIQPSTSANNKITTTTQPSTSSTKLSNAFQVPGTTISSSTTYKPQLTTLSPQSPTFDATLIYAIVIGVVVSVFGLLLVIITAALFCRWHSNKQRDIDSTRDKDKNIELPKRAFKIDWNSALGEGNFGAVYRGTIKHGRHHPEIPTAVKTIKSGLSNNVNTLEVKSMLSEIKVLRHVGKHQNVVSLIGTYTKETTKGKVFVFLEFCSLGSLDKYLKEKIVRPSDEEAHFNSLENAETLNESRNNLQPEIIYETMWTESHADPHNHVEPKVWPFSPDLYRWSCEIANGMEFLTSKKVVHMDLAARNVLLTLDKRAKISDFGLSRRLYDDAINYVKSGNEGLPWRWMAPEALRRREFNEKTDVWSFGVTLWEIYSLGDLPFPGVSCNINSFWPQLKDGLRLEEPTFNSHQMYTRVIRKCWEFDPSNRPTFNELKRHLK